MRFTSNDTAKEKKKFYINQHKFVASSFDILKSIIYAFIIVSIVFTCFFKDASIVGSSMENTLADGDKVMLSTWFYTPRAGDIVAINEENQIEKRIIKRIIATEGQTLKIDYNTKEVIVDGVVLNENYISSFTKPPQHPWDVPYTIPKGYVFVMGDNRNVSLDSRDETIGLVSVDQIIGKAEFVIFPFNKIKYLY